MRYRRVMVYSAGILAVAGSASIAYIVKSGIDADVDIAFYLETISLGALPYFGLAALLWFGSFYLSRTRRPTTEEPVEWSPNPWMPLTGRERLWRALRPGRARRPRGPWAYDRRTIHHPPHQVEEEEPLPDMG